MSSIRDWVRCPDCGSDNVSIDVVAMPPSVTVDCKDCDNDEEYHWGGGSVDI